MGKLIRGFCVAMYYIIAWPIIVLIGLICTIQTIVKSLIDGYGFEFSDIKYYVSSYVEGMRCGHEFNKYWIKHGKRALDLNKLGDL